MLEIVTSALHFRFYGCNECIIRGCAGCPVRVYTSQKEEEEEEENATLRVVPVFKLANAAVTKGVGWEPSLHL